MLSHLLFFFVYLKKDKAKGWWVIKERGGLLWLSDRLKHQEVQCINAGSYNGKETFWFGSSYGLTSFDGKDWKSFTKKQGLTSNQIQTILVENNKIWVGTNYKLNLYKDNVWRTYSTSNSGLINNWVNDITKDSFGRLWFATYGGLSMLDAAGNWTSFTTEHGLASNYVKTVAIQKFKTRQFVWLGTSGYYKGTEFVSGSGVCVFGQKKGNWVRRRHYNTKNSGLSHDWVNSIAIDKNYVWIGTCRGLNRFDISKKDKKRRWKLYNKKNTSLKSDFIQKVWVIDDMVWVAIFGGGLGVLKNDNWTFFTEKNSPLPSNYVYSLLAKDGFLWAGTFKGVVRLELDSLGIK